MCRTRDLVFENYPWPAMAIQFTDSRDDYEPEVNRFRIGVEQISRDLEAGGMPAIKYNVFRLDPDEDTTFFSPEEALEIMKLNSQMLLPSAASA